MNKNHDILPVFRYFLVLLLSVVSLYLFYNHSLLSHLILTHKTIPNWSDELVYHLEAKIFHFYSTLKSPLTIDGSSSEILRTGSHGPFYQLLSGSLTKIWGFNDKSLILLNHSYFIASIIIILISPIKSQKKILATLVVSSFCVPIIYNYTYMQESVNMLFAVTMTFFLYAFDHKREILYKHLYVLSIVIFSLFRPTYLFWLLGLLIYVNKRKDLVLFLITFLTLFISSLLYIKLFIAPYKLGYLYEIQQLISSPKNYHHLLHSLSSHFYHNLKYYFLCRNDGGNAYLFVKYCIFAPLPLCFILGKFKRSKLLISAGIIALVSFVILFLFYDAFSWRDVRFLAPTYYLTVIIISFELGKIVPIVLLSLNLLVFPHFSKLSHVYIQEKIDLAGKTNVQNILDYQNILQNIPDKTPLYVDITRVIRTNCVTTDRWDTSLFYLPLENKDKNLIFYSVVYTNAPSYHKWESPKYRLEFFKRNIPQKDILTKTGQYVITRFDSDKRVLPPSDRSQNYCPPQ